MHGAYNFNNHSLRLIICNGIPSFNCIEDVIPEKLQYWDAYCKLSLIKLSSNNHRTIFRIVYVRFSYSVWFVWIGLSSEHSYREITPTHTLRSFYMPPLELFRCLHLIDCAADVCIMDSCSCRAQRLSHVKLNTALVEVNAAARKIALLFG